MWLKLSESVVLTRRILNAGIGFVRALNRPSSPGRYDSFPSMRFQSKYLVQNRPPSDDPQTLRTGSSSSNTSSSTVGIFLLPLSCPFRMTACRELISGCYPPHHP